MFEHSVRKHQIDRAIVEWEVVRRALLEPGIGESRVAGDVAGDVDLRLFAIHSQDRSTGSCRASDAHRDRARPASHIHHASYVGQEPQREPGPVVGGALAHYSQRIVAPPGRIALAIMHRVSSGAAQPGSTERACGRPALTGWRGRRRRDR